MTETPKGETAAKPAEDNSELIKSLLMLLLNLSPIIASFIFPHIATLLSAIAFFLSLYELNALEIMFGKDPTHLKLTPETMKRTNLSVAGACTLFMVGIIYVFDNGLELFDLRVQDTKITVQDNYIQMLGIAGGLIFIVVGALILQFITFKPMMGLGKYRFQLFQSLILGFILYSFFLGVGGETLINYVLIGVNVYAFFKNISKPKDLKNAKQLYKNVSGEQDSMESSFWSSWTNYYKNFYTRFYGIMILASGFFFGLNFRFFTPSVEAAGSAQILGYQILVLILLAIPFFMANTGLSQVWKEWWKLLILVSLFVAVFITLFIHPEYLPWMNYLIMARPYARETIRIYYGGILLLVFIVFIATSIFSSLSKLLVQSSKEVVDNMYVYLFTDISMILGVYFGGYLAYHYYISNDPTNTAMIGAIVALFTGIAFVLTLVFYFIKKTIFYRDTFLLITICPKCNKHLDHEHLGCKNCNASFQEMVKIYMKSHEFKFPKEKLPLTIVIAIGLLIVEIALTLLVTGHFSGLFFFAAANCAAYLLMVDNLLKLPDITAQKAKKKKQVQKNT